MTVTLFWLVAGALLTVLQWTPYILHRAFLWGFGTFLNNYPEGFPHKEPEPAMWAQRAKRAHLNMVETFPGFAAVILAGELSKEPVAGAEMIAATFVIARILYAVVYTAGTPYLRTPVYLVSWGCILYLGIGLML